MDSRDAKQRSLIFHELLLLLLLLLLGAVKVPGVEYGRPPQVSEPNLDSSKPPVSETCQLQQDAEVDVRNTE